MSRVQDFHRNFLNDPKVKIPWVRQELCGSRVLVMEWIDGIRCTDPAAIRASGLDLMEFIRCGVRTGLRQLLEASHPQVSNILRWLQRRQTSFKNSTASRTRAKLDLAFFGDWRRLDCSRNRRIERLRVLQFGLFHGDPHPGNIFALRDGRIAYVDFGNVAELSQRNKQTLIDAVVHAVNEDYRGMADDFVQLVHASSLTSRNPSLSDHASNPELNTRTTAGISGTWYGCDTHRACVGEDLGRLSGAEHGQL